MSGSMQSLQPAVAGAAQGDARRSQRDARSTPSAARIRASTSSWPATATSSRSSPGNLDELLETLARRAAAMQALLNSMTPEQRDELFRLSEALLDDAGLRDQISQLGEHLRAVGARRRLADAPTTSPARTPSASGRALDTMAELGDLDRLESLLRGVTSPTALAEVDAERVGELLGDDAMRSLQRLAELTRRLADAGLIEHTESGLRLTPRGIRQIGSNALRRRVPATDQGPDRPAPDRAHRLRPRADPGQQALRVRRSVPPRPPAHDPQRPRPPGRRRARSARARPSGLVPDDFEIEQTEHLTRSSTVLMLDLSMSMPMEGRFVPAKKVAMALQALIASQFPRDYLGVIVFSETARVIRAAEIPEASWDYVYGTNMHHALTLARRCSPVSTVPSRSSWSPTASRRLTCCPTARCTSTTRRYARRSRRRCARSCAAPTPGFASTRSCSGRHSR